MLTQPGFAGIKPLNYETPHLQPNPSQRKGCYPHLTMFRWLIAGFGNQIERWRSARRKQWQTVKQSWIYRQVEHRITLNLSTIPKRPKLPPTQAVSANTPIALTLLNLNTQTLQLAEVGFIGLRNRLRLPLEVNQKLQPGKAIVLKPAQTKLLSKVFGYNVSIAPYVQTPDGQVYFEQPFALVCEEGPKVGSALKPRPKVLKAQAQPPQVERK